jgi:hypothetical protein
VPAVVTSDFEKSLKDGTTHELLHILASKHMLEGVRLAFQPELAIPADIGSDVVEFRFTGSVDDVGSLLRMSGQMPFWNYLLKKSSKDLNL